MPRLALAVSPFWEDMGGEDALLLPALAAVDIEAHVTAWDDASIDWAAFDGVAIRSTWDYTHRVAEFTAWTDRVGAMVPLANPAPIVRWNSDKGYLADLSDVGVPIIPTTYIGPGTNVGITDFRYLAEWPEIVVKPSVSAGAKLSGRFDLAHRADADALIAAIHADGAEAMVQPYLPAVDTDGEANVLVFGGDISHAVAKGGVLALGAEPPPDERLALEQWARPLPLTDELAAFSAAALAAVPGAPTLLQARVDSVIDHHGQRRLMELELIEPFLFLAHAPDPAAAAAAFATATHTWLTTS